MRHFFESHNNTALTQHLLHSRPIAIHRHVLQIAGQPAAGVLLSQLVYWTRRGVDIKAQCGWIHKSAEQWERETGMSWKVQKRARQHLIGQGLIEERQVGVPRRLEFRLNLNVFAEKTSQLIQIRLAEDLSLDLFRSDDIVIKQLLGQSISYHRVLARVTTHVNDALLLSRLIHDQRQVGRWQVRSRSDWLRELCMSRDQWETARRHLRLMGVLIERQSNFPRRVNLMINQAALVDCLERQSNGQYSLINPKSRQGLRVQTGLANIAQPIDLTAVGGFGRFRTAEFPTSESPKPAYPKPAYPKASYKAVPNPPAQISQSRPYIKEGLQVGVQQQLHDENGCQIAVGEPSGVVVVCDQAKDSGVARPGPVDRPNPPKVLMNDSVTPNPDNLIWANWLSEEQKMGAWWYLSRLPVETAQTVLDEVAFNHTRKTVENPVGLVRYLVGLVKSESFVAEGASTIAKQRIDRARQLEHEQALQRAVQQAQAVPSPATSESAAVIRANLKAMSEKWKKSLTGRSPIKGASS